MTEILASYNSISIRVISGNHHKIYEKKINSACVSESKNRAAPNRPFSFLIIINDHFIFIAPFKTAVTNKS